MTFIRVTTLILFALAGVSGFSYAEDNNMGDQLKILQQQIQILQENSRSQIDALQAQVNDLKQQVADQGKEGQALKVQLTQRPERPPLVSWGKSWKMRREEGLESESPINISGEIAINYLSPIRGGSSSDQGFRAYEIPELFFDATINDYVTAFAEIPLSHEGGGALLEDGWIDIHKPLELAASGDTGLKIGQFSVPLGWDNDDNDGQIYGGRTSVETSYVKRQRIDGLRLHENKQIGLQANYNMSVDKMLKLDTEYPINLIFSAGVFNGTGSTVPGETVAEFDNDNQRDFAGRVEAHFLNAVLGGSVWYAPATKNVITDTDSLAHTRDVTFSGVHFKYPDVPTPGEDITMGGSKYVFWGEWIWAKAKEENVAGEGDTKNQGGYLELDYSVKPKLIAYVRQDYYDPDTDASNDRKYETTLGIKWEFIKGTELTLDYATDNFQGATEGDRIGAQLKTKF